jgi:uncharacterized protein YndB with AHSA1/START domain
MMDILYRVGIKSGLSDVYTALATRDGLAAWWTTDTQGESTSGGVIQFRFPEGGFDMKVLELRPAERVLWEVVDGPKEWSGRPSVSISSKKATMPSFSSNTRAGESRWNLCTTAAPNGRRFC